MHIALCDELRQEFMQKYSKDYEITGGGLMKTFLMMEVEQKGQVIKLHPDYYNQQLEHQEDAAPAATVPNIAW